LIDAQGRKGIYNYDWAAKMTRSVLSARTIEKSYELLVSSILHMFSEPQPTIRARVVRSMATILKADPELIMRDVKAIYNMVHLFPV